jgi:hypothetical protein
LRSDGTGSRALGVYFYARLVPKTGSHFSERASADRKSDTVKIGVLNTVGGRLKAHDATGANLATASNLFGFRVRSSRARRSEMTEGPGTSVSGPAHRLSL